MLQLPFLNRNTTESQSKFLAITIEANYVRCLAFYSDETGIKVIGQSQQKLQEGAVRAGLIIDKQNVIDSLDVAIQSITTELSTNINSVIFGITADTSIENVVTAKVNRGISGQIVTKEVSNIKNRLEEAAFEQAQKSLAELSGNTDVAIESITTAIVYEKVNNIKVADILNSTGQIIEIAMYNAFATTYHLKSLQQVAKKLNLKIKAIGTNNFAINKLLESSSMENNDYVLIEVGSDYTNIGVVFGSAIIANKSFHIGLNHFLVEISQIMGITLEEAANLLEHHIEGKLTKSESVVVQDCLEEVLETWLKGLELAFQEFTGVKTFAPNIYLYGMGTRIPELFELLENEPWTKAIPFKSPPEIKVLSAKDFGKIIADEFLETLALGTIYESLQ